MFDIGRSRLSTLTEWVMTTHAVFDELEVTLADYEELPENVCALIEVVEGRAVVSPSAVHPHGRIMVRLGAAVDAVLPPEWTVTAGEDLRFADIPLYYRKPDLMVYSAALADGEVIRPEHVLLVVEIVSPGSEKVDREYKHAEYARCGIRHYWRIEQRPTVSAHVFELEDATGAYVSTGIYHDRLKISAPFAIDVDLPALAEKKSMPTAG